jgi:hypothetical protein
LCLWVLSEAPLCLNLNNAHPILTPHVSDEGMLRHVFERCANNFESSETLYEKE